MNKLVFYYGVMGCSKSANALMTKFQYEDRGLNVWLIKPSIDNRADKKIDNILKDRFERGEIKKIEVKDKNLEAFITIIPSPNDPTDYEGKIYNIKSIEKERTSIVESRVGIKSFATNIFPEDNLIDMLNNYLDITKKNVIICDEAQFMTPDQIEQLRFISDNLNVDCFCYGLRTDFMTNLFPGSKRLFELADEVHELESVCDCGKHAIVNARLDSNGKVITTGSQVEIGGNEKYKAMCFHCWKQNIEK